MLNFKSGPLAYGLKIAAPILSRIGFKDIVARAARRYVSSDEKSGKLQLEILRRTGCVASSSVLEIGCGCLNAGIPIIDFLDAGNYVGLDPNRWLIDSTLRRKDVRRLVEDKRARFLHVDTFDASKAAIEFDFVISHSVLSHCAHWQLDQFLRNAGKVLASDGRIVASLRLSEGNEHGSVGSPDKEDSMCTKWQYPDVSYFKMSTVRKAAEDNGLTATHVPEYTAYYTSHRPLECHDWFVFSRAT